MGTSLLPCFVPLCLALAAIAQTPAPLRPLPVQHPEVVLASSDGPLDPREWGLGDGGVHPTERTELRFTDDGCITPGGITVACRSVGVKIVFPSGRELLLAPDGGLHLRSGEACGPFASGLELWLGDGSRVRITLAQARTDRVREVVVVHGDRALQPWRKGEAATEVARTTVWSGQRLACLGDGGDLYRPIALGPMVTLERELVAAERADKNPERRLVLLRDALVASLATMQRQHRDVSADVRHAVTAVAALADRGDVVFPAGASLARAERDELRWLLRGGFELEIELDGLLAPRLGLYAGQASVPMIEWTLRGDSAAFLANPRDDQPEKRWHGNGTRLPKVAVELQAREHLHERAAALRVLQQFVRR
ncbi:MAG: hypothetical protein JNK15_03500 [Planctomycetes bacterium]|nr:hypothetical protein [Planctomycetota bacterium]